MQVMYPICLVADMIFIFHELKSIHLRTLNRERAEMLADHFVTAGTVQLPSEISRRERVFFASDFDRSGVAVRFKPIHKLFDTNAALEAAAAACQGGFVLKLCRSGGVRRRRKGGRGNWLSVRRGDCFLGIALHKEATQLQILASVLAACSARRRLQALPSRDGDSGSPAGPADWWHKGGKVTEQAQACLEQGIEYGLRHVRELSEVLRDQGWIVSVFMLGMAERARFSTKLRRNVGGVRWLTFR